MTLVSTLRLIDFPRFHGRNIEDVKAHMPRLNAALERLRDTIAEQAETEIILDSAGRVIVDSGGHKVYDGAGTLVIDGTTIEITSDHILASSILASSIGNEEVTEAQGEWLASETALATAPVVAASASATFSAGFALILAGAAYGFVPTSTSGTRLTARLKRDSTALMEQQVAIGYATSEEVLGRFDLSYLDTAATGEHDWSLELEMSATTFASSFISDRGLTVVQGKT